MTLGDIALLAAIQGFTEFLPVSSSGHLVLGQHFLQVQAPGVALEVALHLGTLISVCIVFARDIKLLLLAGLSFLRRERAHTPEVLLYRRLVVMLMLASLPTAMIGILLQDVFAALFGAPRFIGFALIATGVILTVAGRIQGTNPLTAVTPAHAVIIGVAQGLAITPGISRSGLTISAGLLAGYNRDAATRFSFLLSIPAILGAAVLEVPSLWTVTLGFPLWWMAVGIGLAALTGVIAIVGLVQMLKRGKLSYFAYYVWVIGILTILMVR